jgi:hypothetical protein
MIEQLTSAGTGTSSWDEDGRHIFMDYALTANLEREFNRLGRQAVVGNPRGKLAYGYLRVSSGGQAKEGRSGLHRQLEHIAAKAAEEGLALPWDMIYCDDHTEFRFEDRPGLKQATSDSQGKPQGSKLIVEQTDRMSRDHAWRYGYLPEQFLDSGVEFVYRTGYTQR